MAIDFRRGTIEFDPTSGQLQSEVGAVVFQSNVRRADVAISAFDMQYTNGDHHVLRETVKARVERIQGPAVFFRVDLLLRDSSGSIDDPFKGRVDVLVLADVEQARQFAVTRAAVLEQQEKEEG